MTNLQKYEYKDSGIKWIGKIPKHWKIVRLKDIGKSIIGLTYKPEDIVDEGKGIFVLRSSNIQDGKIVSEDNVYVDKIVENDLKLKENDILICSRNGSRELIGKNALIPKQYKNNTFGAFMTVYRSVYNRYIFYVLNSSIFNFYIGTFLTSTINQLTSRNFNNIKIPFTFEITEQKNIIVYLDKKCEKIDDVLEKTRKEIELLKEYKKSLITEVVTKGLNPKVELKDSGIKWIGKIPKHWEVVAIKRVVTNLICGIASTPDYVSEKDGVLFLSAQNIQNNKIDLSTTRYIPICLHKKLTKNIKPKKGDILQVRVGATIGNVAIVDIEEEFSVYVSLTLIQVNKQILNRYLRYYLSTDSFRKNAELFIDFAGTQGNLNVLDLKNMKTPLPPKQEQQAIADYLDKKCEKIDKTIETKEKLIEKLEEYKKSLIYECVTGKKQII